MISAVIITKNEEKNILDCIDSLSWVDEIVVVDDFSDDRTIEVIRNLNLGSKIRIFKRRLERNFSSQRNFALSKTKYDWVLFIDADERITDDLRKDINAFLVEEKDSSKTNGFFIKREDVMWGKKLKHGEVGDISLLRFGKKGTGLWKGKVHERWEIKGKTDTLQGSITHFPHQTLSEFLFEINEYTTIRAKELFDLGVKSSLVNVVFYTKGKFLLNYILKLGFLDGPEGLIHSILMSFHSFLVRGKLWLLWKKK